MNVHLTLTFNFLWHLPPYLTTIVCLTQMGPLGGKSCSNRLQNCSACASVYNTLHI